MDENISAKYSFTLAEIELLPLCGVGIMVPILLVVAVVGVIRFLEMLAGNITVAAVVSMTWLLEMLSANIIAAVFDITQLLEMLAGEYHGIQLARTLYGCCCIEL